MSKEFEGFTSAARGFAKSPLGIIALFIVLVYGLAALVITVASGTFEQPERIPLVYFLVLFPVLVLGVFAWLVSRHSDKLFGPSDFSNEENYIRMRMMAVASLAAATPRAQSILSESDVEDIVELVNQAGSAKRPRGSGKNRILWVDDRQNANLYERKAFESVGLEVTSVSTTDEALKALNHNAFAAIISDMSRPEGDLAGYDLLQKSRKGGFDIPFFIYSSSRSPEHIEETKRQGGTGQTNHPQELFKMVTSTIIKAAG